MVKVIKNGISRYIPEDKAAQYIAEGYVMTKSSAENEEPVSSAESKSRKRK